MRAAGFAEVEAAGRGRPFSGAGGQRTADKFETEGVNNPRPEALREEGDAMATILYLGTAGSNDPTRAGLPFNFAMGALDAGHRPEIFLAGEAAYLMKDAVLAAVQPVAMPALKQMLDEVIAQRVPIFV